MYLSDEYCASYVKDLIILQDQLAISLLFNILKKI